jgi:hypothetical protein
VQVEWHTRGFDIEVQFSETGTHEWRVEDLRSEKEEEGAELGRLATYIAEMAGRLPSRRAV